MICTKAYSELLCTLYAAPLDEAQWQLFLTQLCEFTHSTVAMFLRNDVALGNLVAEAFERAGAQGIVDVQFGIGVSTVLEVVEGMAFDRGYLSHHMVTDVERMQVVLDNPYILMTDHKILSLGELTDRKSVV